MCQELSPVSKTTTHRRSLLMKMSFFSFTLVNGNCFELLKFYKNTLAVSFIMNTNKYATELYQPTNATELYQPTICYRAISTHYMLQRYINPLYATELYPAPNNTSSLFACVHSPQQRILDLALYCFTCFKINNIVQIVRFLH